MKRIAILTAGGDTPALNATLHGAIARANLGLRGPALLFENIKGYESGLCTQFMTCGLASREKVALMLGLDPKTTDQALVRHLHDAYRHRCRRAAAYRDLRLR